MKELNLDPNIAIPLYKQLMKTLRKDIADGVYPVHTCIPSEPDLSKTYGVSRVTVRKALGELEKEGLLDRKQGKGTFVAAPRIRKDLRHVNSFHEACKVMGVRPGTRVISSGLVSPGEMDQRELLVAEEDHVVELVRVRYADDLPVIREVNHFPSTYTWLLQEKLTDSLYNVLQAHGIEPGTATHEVSLAYADAETARELSISSGDAVLLLTETIYDQEGAPLHTSRQWIHGDRFTFRI